MVTGKKRDGSDATQVVEVNFINESGLYSLIFGSRLASAKKFKRWVTAEVLPVVRKNGFYETQEYKALMETLADLRQKNRALMINEDVEIGMKMAEVARLKEQNALIKRGGRLERLEMRVKELENRVKVLEDGGRDNEEVWEKMRSGKYGSMNFNYLN